MKLFSSSLISGALACALSVSSSIAAAAQSAEMPAYKNTSLPFEQRVDDLIARMSAEEKIAQLSHNSPAIPRLDVPKYGWWNESLHGVAFSGVATVFPEPIGLGASFNEGLLFDVATAISDEARAKHHQYVKNGKRNNFQGLTFWAPNINIFRDPRWGRGIETYGEDPHLTGRLGVAFVKGLQGDDPKYLKLVATPKHYAVHSGPEPQRHEFDAITNRKDLYETYLPHFKASIQEGGAYSIMCAYNRYMGKAACGSDLLLQEILRDEWGFDGYVVSDCAAVRDIHENHKISASPEEAVAIALKAGTDLNCGGYYSNLVSALEKGYVSEKDIDIAAKRLFMARFKLGMFDPDHLVPFANISADVVNSKANADLALKAAQESIVLLKNNNNLLPLKKDGQKIAVIGPNANDVEVLLGNYNGRPLHAVTPLEGIKDKAANSQVNYVLGSDWAKGIYVLDDLPASFLFHMDNGVRKPGLKGDYYNNAYAKGTPAHTRIDKTVNFDWKSDAPIKGMPNDHFGIRWSGLIVAPKDGEYTIGAEGHTAYDIHLDDELFIKYRGFYHTNENKYGKIRLKAGQEVKIRVKYFAQSGDANFRLTWVPEHRELVDAAVAAAEQADVVIMAMGLSPRLEGEELKDLEAEGFAGGDRVDIGLPKVQKELIQAVQKTGKPVVLVLLNGSAIATPWESANVDAIVEAWYPGQAAGTAIADVLFGDYNPAGRMPVTVYSAVEQLPPFTDYSMKNRTYRFFEGKPLYPFGFGLSYTAFNYSKFKLPKKAKVGATVKLSAVIKNTGKRSGDEVVQVYVSKVDDDAGTPLHSLRAFKRINLKNGSKQKVSFDLPASAFETFDDQGKAHVLPGQYTVSIGGVLPGHQAATTEVLSKTITLK